ncbi:MAG: hypothetical protein KJ063_09940 [Anaerolineae bacterium]|nr:hypothetical protein [Anaerolineae bacterium]
MMDVPVIASLLAVPGLAAADHQVILLGVQLEGKPVVWGEIAAASTPLLPHYPDGLDAAAALHTLHSLIIPALQGQRLDSFRALAAKIEALRETITLTRTISPSPDDKPTFSRRALLTGDLSPPSPRQETYQIERPLHPAILYGVTTALLAAASLAHNCPISHLIAREYNLPQPEQIVPLHAELVGPQSARLSLQQRAASLGFSLEAKAAAAQMGPQSEKLQQFVRQLQQLIVQMAAADHYPVIYLDLQGGMGVIYAQNEGKILGAVYGLQQAARPVSLWLADPVRLPDFQAQRAKMVALKEMIRFRGVDVKLIAGWGVTDATAAQQFLQEKAADGVCLNVHQIGSIAQAVEAALLVKEQEGKVLLCGRDPHLIAPLALAVRPDLTFLCSSHDGIAPLHNQMIRILFSG